MELANLDMDVLRTLAVAIDLGGFGKAAERLGRSQSAADWKSASAAHYSAARDGGLR